MPDVRLKVDGIVHAGWQQIRLGFSLESIANTFELTLTDKWSADTQPRPVKMGAACEIWIDETKVITGHVDDVYPEYDATNHTVVVNGRSKAGDLVDCTYKEGKEFKNQTLKQLADKLSAPFGIKVFVAEGVNIGAPFKTIEIETGETIFEFLEQAARIRALRLVSNVDGDIVITQAGKKRVSTTLVLGENILSASGEFSLRDRYGDITVIGSQDSSDNVFGEAAAHMKGQYADPFFSRRGRYRPITITADGNVTLSDCKKRAQWEVNTRFGRSQSIVYTVAGWLHNDGLWQANRLVHVKDHFMGLDNDRLIADVQFVMDEGGKRTELRVMPPEAFELVKLPEPTSDDASGWG